MTIKQVRNFVFIAKEYLGYFLDRTDHHSLQTPFAYFLYRNLRSFYRLNCKGNPDLEKVRIALAQDHRVLNIKDEGAGSIYSVGTKRSIASICKITTSSLSYNLLYQFLVTQTPSRIVLELGTSLGINTGYLAAKATGLVYTFEADAGLLEVARQNLGIFSNIRFILGNIQGTLPEFLKGQSQIDFIQVDAHHTFEATIEYCKLAWPYLHENSILVIGDIHWSADMKKAWSEIKKFPKVRASMDFFECGVLFFKQGIQLEHHVLYYPTS